MTEIVAEEAYFADSKKNEGTSEKPAGGSNSNQADGFYPVDDDDELPF